MKHRLSEGASVATKPHWSTRGADPAEYVSLRVACGMRRMSEVSALGALKGSQFSVWVRQEGALVGMGRVLGDHGSLAVIADVAVAPDVQRQGWGTRIVTRLLNWCDEELPTGIRVGLLPEGQSDGFFSRFGFENAAGMVRVAA